MGYLNNQVVTVDAILTKKGRELLAKGDGSFNITQFALSDDEVDYTLYNPNHPSGSAYYGEAIENMPLLEAFPDETQMMKYKLVSLNRGTSVMPILQLGTSDISIANGGPFTITPATINYLNSNGPESSGYQFTISDVRVFGSFTGTGLEDTPGAQALAVSNEQTVITNGTATSQTVIGYSCQVVGTSVPTLFSTTSTLYATLTVIGLDSGARAQIPVFIRNKSIVTQTASSLS
jgi:hypothetical protein